MEINLTQLIEAYSRIARVNHYHIFILAVILDIVSGYAKALVTKDLDSKVGLKGIVKHICIVLLVFITCPYLWLLNKAPVALFLLYSIVITYAISIVENYDAISPGTLPKGISQFFRRTKDSMDKVDLDEFIKKDDK